MRSAPYSLRLTCAILALSCAGVIHAEQTELIADKAPTARIRLFGQNAVMVKFYRNSTCHGRGADETKVSGGLGDAFSSFIGTVKNVSIGMKETPNTVNLAKRNGYASKAYFREYELAAGQPLTIAMKFRDMMPNGSVYCRTIAGTFTPSAGKDYEAALDLGGGGCKAVIREIAAAENGEVSMQDVDVQVAAECS
jgi:hypothetical protein